MNEWIEMNAVEKENVASDVTETEMNLMYLYAIEFLNNSYRKRTEQGLGS